MPIEPAARVVANRVQRQGRPFWEADILPPEIIEGALDAHIAGWLDRRLWRRRDAEIERGRGLL